MKLVHLVGFITKKFVTMHGHVKVKKEKVEVTVIGCWKDGHVRPKEGGNDI